MSEKKESTYDLLTHEEAASYLRIAKGTLRKWVYERRSGLKVVRMGRRVLYDRKDLDTFIKSQREK